MNAHSCIFTILCFRLILTDSKCSFTNVSTGLEEWRCCDNWEDRNGICFECPFGSRSLYGEMCKKCDVGYYGRKCGSRCYCTQFQACDPVNGCTNLTLTTISRFIEVTDHSVSNKEERTVVSNYKQVITENQDTLLSGIHAREIVIYSICAIVLTIFTLLGTVLLKRYRRMNNTFHSGLPVNRIIIENIIAQENDTTDEMVEGIYETIDESNFIDLPTPVEELDVNSSTTSSDSVNVASSLGDNYANPYQPIIFYPDTRDYSLIHKVSSDSGSSFEYSNNDGSGYLHPYQKIVTDACMHEYSSIHLLKCDKLIGEIDKRLSFSSSNCLNLFTSDNSKRHRSLPDLNISKAIHCFTKHNSDGNIRTTGKFLTICDARTNQQPASFDKKICISQTSASATITKRLRSENATANIPYIQMGDLLNEPNKIEN